MLTISQLRLKIGEKLGAHGSDLARNALLAGGTRAFGVLLSFALLWLVGRRFGDEGAGLFTVPQSILIILRIFVSMGLGLAMVRLIAQLKPGEIRPHYHCAKWTMLAVSIVVGTLVALGSKGIANWLFDAPNLSWGIALAGIGLPFFAISQLHAEVARGLKRMVASELFRGVGIPLVALISFAFFFRSKAEHAFVGYVVGCAIVAVISFGFVRLALKPGSSEKRIRPQQLLALSLPMMIGEFGVILLGRIDHIMLEMLGSTADAGVYGVVLRLSAIVLFLPGAIGAIAAPKIAGVFWSDDPSGFPALARLVAKLMFWTALLPAIVIFVAPGFWMSIFGPSFERGWLALVGLAFAGVLIASTGFIGSILNMTGGEKFYRNTILVALGANIILNLVLIPPFNLNGAALASLLTVIFWNAAGVIFIWRKHGFLLLHIPFWPRKRD